MRDLRVRKRIRLSGYDYSSEGYYFITICVRDGHVILSEIVGANCVRPHLTEIGVVVENEILRMTEVYDSVHVDKYVIMPNHIHLIIVISNDENNQYDDDRQTQGGRTQFAPTISRIIKQFKGVITKQIGFSIWQRSFHDRIIRSEADYIRIWRYIDDNPIIWKEDCYYPNSK